ncbi:MAG TPA: TonB-dependent receptor [Caulobacteraceae bacterium]|jgi:outer membrane receptor protein involved in Fe transport|nr:TonB-dependent receptor [Caulobacteraceae bacterium]
MTISRSNIAYSRLLVAGASALAICTAALPALAQTAAPAAAPAADDTALQEIVVTGSRLGRTGFSAPTPLTVVGAQQFERQAASNISDVLNQLPAFRAQTTPATSSINISNAGAQLADLRGLGSNRSLVLLNGRRVVAGTVAGTNPYSPAGAVDLNMIPSSMIERAEVVTGGTSAVYGSDAVAGVVNLILNDRLQGLKGNVQYGFSDRGDGHEYMASLAGGTNFAGGRGHLILGGEYVDQRGVGECRTRPNCGLQYSSVSNPTPQTNGLARSILMPDTRTATASFNGLITAGPLRGTEFRSNGTTFQHDYGTYYGAGLFQSGGSADPANPFLINFPLVAPVERYSLLGSGKYDFNESLSGFFEASFAHSHGTTVASQVRDTGTITIQKDNAFLPASVVNQMTAAGITNFSFGRIANDIGPSLGDVKRSTSRVATGLSGKIGENWTWDSYYQYGQTDYHQLGYKVRINDNYTRAVDAVRAPDGRIVCRSTLTDPTNPLVQGCAPLNLFGENNFSPEAVAYAFGTASQDTKLTQHVAAATIRGDLFTWAPGAVSGAAGVEYRVEDASGTSDPISSALRFNTNPGAAISGPAIKVKEAFAEIGVPLMKDAPLAQSLEVNGALRVTDYSTTGTATTWKVGAVWEPTGYLRLRGNRSRDIRAPNFFELYSPQSRGNQFLTDPRLGNASQLTAIITGGNPALKNEVADTLTFGAVVSPTRNFQVSVDYYDISLDGAVSTIGGQTIVDRCEKGAAEFCPLIDRSATGAITLVRNINLNVNNLTTRGVDFEASYRMDLGSGRLTLSGLATYVKDLITADSFGSVDRAGQNGVPPSTQPGVPHWIVNGTVGWASGRFAGQVQGRYISKGIYNALQIGPGQDGYSPTLTNSISDNFVPDMFYLNLNAQYDVMRSGGRTLQIYGAINNLLDVQPPADLPSSFANGNPILYDVVGRAFRIGARFTY